MNKQNIKLNLDNWLSQVFKKNVYALSMPQDFETEDLSSLKQDISNLPKPFFAYVKLPADAIKLSNSLCEIGFRVVDISVTFERTPESLQSQSSSRISIAEAQASDTESILNLAENTFRYSRFHLDPEIPKTLANNIKKLWIQNYLNKTRGDKIWIAKVGKDVAGFLAVISTNAQIKTSCIDLIAVSNQFQKQSVGQQLVNHFINDSFKNFDKLIVGTQVSNIPSMRLYQKCGFRLEKSQLVLHGHFK